MQLTDQQVKEFQALYKEEFDEEISKKDAYEKASQLVDLVKIVYDDSNINRETNEN